MNISKIKWGIIGCGNIANKFTSNLVLVDAAELTAVASRSYEKVNEFAQKHSSKEAYVSYDALFKDTDVYIAAPHTSHAELSVKAMEHGKCFMRKTLALNKKEVIAMIETSECTNRFFMEVLWTRCNPSLIAVKERIDNGELAK